MYNCIYKNCNLDCKNRSQHNARYSKIKKNTKTLKFKENFTIKKSSHINYDVLKKLLGTI